VPAERLRLTGGALREHDVDEGAAAVVHRLFEGALEVLRLLDKEAFAAEGFHHPVIAGAVDQRVRLHVEHRVVRDLGHAGADAAVVEHDDFDREVVANERLHLHAREADRRVAGEVDDRPVGLGDGGGDGLAEADAHRAVGAGIEAGAGVGDIQLREGDIHRARTLGAQNRVLRHPGGDVTQRTVVIGWRLVVLDLRPDLRRILLRLLRDHLAPRRVLWMEPLAAGECGVQLPGPRVGGDRLARACPRAGPRPDPWADQGHLGRLVVADLLGRDVELDDLHVGIARRLAEVGDPVEPGTLRNTTSLPLRTRCAIQTCPERPN